MRLKNHSAEIDFQSQPNDFRFSTECFFTTCPKAVFSLQTSPLRHPKGRFQSSNIPFASTPKSPQS